MAWGDVLKRCYLMFIPKKGEVLQMRFHEAYELMSNGKGIRRHHWPQTQCLRMKKGVMYLCTDDWHKPVKSLSAKCICSSDWLTTDMYPIKKTSKQDLLDYLQQLNKTV